MNRIRLLLLAGGCLVGLYGAPSGYAQDLVLQEAQELKVAFEDAGVVGTFVLREPGQGVLRVHDATRARTRFLPASTFKIPNSLIGLSCGAVADVDEVLPYGGKTQPMKSWEHDMSLRDAIKISNVPIYQELARRIGLERMRSDVEKLGYGNATIGTVVDRFWLDGPLEISAVEQVAFLGRLASGDVAFPPDAVRMVKEITLLEADGAWQLHGKTGWATASEPKIGWFVGWVTKDGRDYPFALNIDMPDIDLAGGRIPLAERCLRIFGVLPEDGAKPVGPAGQ